jgi:hypothetical protein
MNRESGLVLAGGGRDFAINREKLPLCATKILEVDREMNNKLTFSTRHIIIR